MNGGSGFFGHQAKFSHPQPLRVTADHEGFPDFHTGSIADVNYFATLSNRHRYGLLAEHVFARHSGANRPRDVQVIR
jgi:hypothetical protein